MKNNKKKKKEKKKKKKERTGVGVISYYKTTESGPTEPKFRFDHFQIFFYDTSTSLSFTKLNFCANMAYIEINLIALPYFDYLFAET